MTGKSLYKLDDKEYDVYKIDASADTKIGLLESTFLFSEQLGFLEITSTNSRTGTSMTLSAIGTELINLN